MNIEANALLSQYTTFKLGGPVKAIHHCATADELTQTVKALHAHQKPFILLGGGSNIVAADDGMDIDVIRYVSETPLISQVNETLTVTASTSLDALALYCVDAGLIGLNTCHGIPGTVGGAIVGNAGAFGKQIGDVISTVTLLNHQGETRVVTRDELHFEYRHSKLKDTDDIVVDATFDLKPGDPIALAHERAETLKLRWEKHPNLKTHPCAGSFFRNIEPTSKADRRQAAGWFLEEAGGKSLHVGGAHIFDKHANIIIKGPHCTAQDVHDLHLKMKEMVKKQFNIDLIREVRFAGPITSSEQINPTGFW